MWVLIALLLFFAGPVTAADYRGAQTGDKPAVIAVEGVQQF
jgi:hypothetical protein